MKSGKLIIVRHTQSQWNKLNKWTGKTDIGLSEEGKEMAKKIGHLLKGIEIDEAITSNLTRTKETLSGIEETLQNKIPNICTNCIDERDYGDYTGKNKLEVEKECGTAAYLDIRRGWVCPIPNGETLKDVFERAVPYYTKEILPKLLNGKNILIVAHGNSIRAMVKYIENISDEDISKVEMPFNEVYVYEVDQEGKKVNKEILKVI
jgi:2,3-bisphosphoglycerate-dependent phosphoglycerate mutase